MLEEVVGGGDRQRRLKEFVSCFFGHFRSS